MQPYPKIFVLDTNVLMHDPGSLFRFKEHDVYIPMVVLEELDAHKTGMSEVARNARQSSRFIEDILAGCIDLEAGAPLPAIPQQLGGRLFITLSTPTQALPGGLNVSSADNQLLAITKDLTARFPDRAVTLVTKDINLRIKARTLRLPTEDYTTDRVLDDADLLYRGIEVLPSTPDKPESWQSGDRTLYKITSPYIGSWFPNQCLISEGANPLQLRVSQISQNEAILETLNDYTKGHQAVWGIHARNTEQNCALNLLMDPQIDFVTLLGHAGTGKTLLTLAAALHQTIEKRIYAEIIVTRVTIPMGEDIGFLPGTEEEKMEPWMGALEDNLEVLNHMDLETRGHTQWARSAAHDLIRARLKIKSLNFMRGRTFLEKFIIVDEAQNLTAHQMKALITRAGPGTKVVCLGNIAQIDTPYLTETTSGLTYIVDRFKSWQHSGHITLKRGERSRLADHATAIL